MKFLNLIYNLKALLFLKNVNCSKKNEITGPQDSDNINNKQSLAENPKLDNNDALKKIIENESFFNFLKSMEKAHEMFKELEEGDIKSKLAFQKCFEQKLELFSKKTLINSKPLDSVIYESYLDETIELLDEFILLLENKKDEDIAMRLPKLFKDVVLELDVSKSLIPDIIELFDKKFTKRKSSNFNGIIKTLKLLEKQIGELQKKFKLYWDESIDFLNFYNKVKIQPSELKTILEKLKAGIPILEKKHLIKQAIVSNKAIIIFSEKFTGKTETEKGFFNDVHSSFIAIWMSKTEVERRLRSYKKNRQIK